MSQTKYVPVEPTEEMMEAGNEAYIELAGEVLPVCVLKAYAAMVAAAPSSSAPDNQQGYVDAFYEIAAMLGVPAQPLSPKEVYETQIKPKLAALLSAPSVPATGDREALEKIGAEYNADEDRWYHPRHRAQWLSEHPQRYLGWIEGVDWAKSSAPTTVVEPATDASGYREKCIACSKTFSRGDLYYGDADGGFIHAECAGPEREGYTNCDGDPLGPDDAIPTPLTWADEPADVKTGCDDCGRLYGDEHGFPDLVVPHDVWNNHIMPGSAGGGLLCPSCLCKRAHEAGVQCEAIFRSGPFAQDDAASDLKTRLEIANAGLLAALEHLRDYTNVPGSRRAAMQAARDALRVSLSLSQPPSDLQAQTGANILDQHAAHMDAWLAKHGIEGDNAKHLRPPADLQARVDRQTTGDNDTLSFIAGFEAGGKTERERSELLEDEITDLKARLETAHDALRPFSAAVFNDNGDVTLSTGDITQRDYLRADAVLSAALRAGKQEGGA